jgi:hypothetical protein
MPWLHLLSDYCKKMLIEQSIKGVSQAMRILILGLSKVFGKKIQ